MMFAQNQDCRMLSFLKHFGDVNDRKGPCETCDRCVDEVSDSREVNKKESSIATQIVAALKHQSGLSVGRLFDEVLSSKISLVRKEFENILTPDKLTELSAEAGLDKAVFNQCLVSGKHKSSVDADLKKSEQDGLTGTPLIIINDQKVVGPQPYSTYKTLLGIALR
ncbi:MAG: DsbA family protein, partial [Patescibacteria group bacterium]